MVSLQEILKTQTETVLEEAEKREMSGEKYDKANSAYYLQNIQLKYIILFIIRINKLSLVQLYNHAHSTIELYILQRDGWEFFKQKHDVSISVNLSNDS